MKVLIVIASFTLLVLAQDACARQSDNGQAASPSEAAPARTQTQSPQAETPDARKQSEPSAAPEASNPGSQKPAAKHSATKSSHQGQVKKRRTRVVKPSSTADPPKKVIVREGGARDTMPQISPAMSQERQTQQREETAQLLATTDENLKKLAGRQLTSNQQGIVTQIRNYMQQSQAASKSGDLERANTLALKAHLLSDDLIKR